MKPSNRAPWCSTVMWAFWGMAAVAFMQFLTRLSGGCEIPDSTVARCASTGEISLIIDGRRRQFTGEVYAAWGSPPIQWEEEGTCHQMQSCPAGVLLQEPVPAETCRIAQDSIVRCKATGGIFLIEGGERRRFSAEAYAAFGAPGIHLNEPGTCDRIYQCPVGEPMPEPSGEGTCDLPDESVVRCLSTGTIAFIDQGTRRVYSLESYIGYGSPQITLNETGACPRLFACPVGEPMPQPSETGGPCSIPDGSIVRCIPTGEIALIDGGKRRKYSPEAYLAFGSPKIQMNFTGVCLTMFNCPAGPPMPRPTSEGSCELHDGLIVKCITTGEISLIDNGVRRMFSVESFLAYGSPEVRLNLTGACGELASCRLGDPMPQPAGAGECRLPNDVLARCSTTGEISIIDDGMRRWFSAEVFELYGFPEIQVNETGSCPLLSTCTPGGPVPQPPTGGCAIAPGSVVHCNSTKAIALIDEKGQRRAYRPDVYLKHGEPEPVLVESGICPQIYACPAGPLVSPEDPAPVFKKPVSVTLSMGGAAAAAGQAEVVT